MFPNKFLDTFFDELIEEPNFAHLTDFSKSCEILLFFEFLRLNKSFNFFAVHDNGISFFKINYGLKEKTRFELGQKKIVAFKRILAAAFDFRTEFLALCLENEGSIVKVLKIDDNYIKSPSILFKINVNFAAPAKPQPLFYNSSVEFQSLVNRKHFGLKFDVVSLYGELYLLALNSIDHTLSLIQLSMGNRVLSYKLPESGALKRGSLLQHFGQFNLIAPPH